ncbi:MAG: class I SAM-dependent methyltransferase [Bacteroidetes bacterium]|nr:MAG: class I SAM-dependent methyltransferase [Bacteroidota bacterium]
MNKSEKLWDKLSKYYDNETKRFDWLRIKIIEKTKRYLKVSDTVLECGCGTGTITVEIANNAKEIHAFDISAGMIDIAKEKAYKRKIENIDFVQTTIFDERYKRESFNFVIVFNVLHLLEDKQKVIKRIEELLKPGGHFISVTPCSGEKKKSLKTIFESIKMLMFLLTKIRMIPFKTLSKGMRFKIFELKDLISGENFQIVEAEKISEEHYFIVAMKK